VALHGLEPGQLLHLGVALLVVCPHTEGALHQQLAQVTEVSLKWVTCKTDDTGQQGREGAGWGL
jgi:hypothetical protein